MLSAVVLAAGKASRMGSLKQVLPWQAGRTILETVVYTVLACPEVDDEVRVIVGAGREQVKAMLQKVMDPRLRVMENQDYVNGMLSSIKTGVANLPAASEGFLIFLGDQPLIGPDLVQKLIRHWQRLRTDFLVPVYNGRRGHPVLVSSDYVEQISSMSDASGGLRKLLYRFPERVAELKVESPAIHIDLDYPEDYRKYRPKGEEI